MREEKKWQHTREIISIIYNVNRGKHSPAKTGKELIPLSIDEFDEEDLTPLTLEEHKELLRKFGINGKDS